jgi:hypothetical protein
VPSISGCSLCFEVFLAFFGGGATRASEPALALRKYEADKAIGRHTIASFLTHFFVEEEGGDGEIKLGRGEKARE